MIGKKSIFLFFALLLGSYLGFSQEREYSDKEAILKYESSWFMEWHSVGVGFGYRYGKFIDGYKKRTYDFSISNIRDPRQVKVNSFYTYSTLRYYYGKMNYLYELRALRGIQKVIATKPYWGGVEIRYFHMEGVNLGLAKPIYHYIYKYEDGGSILLEKYDPLRHDYQDIYKRGPFTKGLDELTLHPGITLKTGLNVEFGTLSQITSSVEAGIVADLFFPGVKLMSNSNDRYFNFSIYASYHVGKRYNK